MTVRATLQLRDDHYPNLTKTYSALLRTVRDSGLLRRRRGFYMSVMAGLTVAFAGLLAGGYLLGDSWFQLLIAGALGIVLTQFAFLAHEASHRQIFQSGPMNDKLGRLLAVFVVGMSYSWWMNKHNRHHGNPNRLGHDPDIETDTISFYEEEAAKSRGFVRWITQRQGTLFFPLLLLEGLNLHALSVRSLVSRGFTKSNTIELSVIVVRFIAYFGILFTFLSWPIALAFLGVQLGVFGLYMGASFAPNHKGLPIIPEDSRLDFFSKQVLTSRNVSGGLVSTAAFGGLNYQIEHHLFPNMPRPHLAKARVIVREYCESLSVPYHETTVWQSWGIVIRYLNRVGLAARDPWECPMVEARR